MSGFPDVRGIRVQAARDVVLDDDSDYHIRRAFRWYAANCSTPLHQVPDLPLAHVLQHYYEATYETLMEDPEGREALREEIRSLTATEADRAAARQAHLAADADLRRLQAEADEQAAKDLVEEAAQAAAAKAAEEEGGVSWGAGRAG